MNEERRSDEDKRGAMETARLVGLGVVAVIIILFAVFNAHTVEVSYVFGTGHWPLIIVILVSVLLGILLDRLFQLVQKRKRKKAAKASDH